MCSAFFRRPFRLKRAIIVKCLPPCHPNGKRKTARLLSQSGCLIGAGTKSRTRDPLITSQVLYQLSYTGIWDCTISKNGAGTKSRTRDPLITSQVLYQLSYTGKEVELCR